MKIVNIILGLFVLLMAVINEDDRMFRTVVIIILFAIYIKLFAL